MSVQVIESATGRVVGGARSNPALRYVPMSAHPEGCTCSFHDRTEVECPQCGKPCKGRAALGGHVAWVHRRRRRNFQKVLVPDGLGYLQAVLRDPHRAVGLHLGELPKFAQRLAQRRKRRYGKAARRRMRAALAHACELVERSPEEPFAMLTTPLVVPAALGQVALQIANEADVSPSVITVALLSYGLEALAKELRVWRTAPAPRLPGSALVNAKGAAYQEERPRAVASEPPAVVNELPSASQSTPNRTALPRI